MTGDTRYVFQQSKRPPQEVLERLGWKPGHVVMAPGGWICSMGAFNALSQTDEAPTSDGLYVFAEELDGRMKDCLPCQVTVGGASRETCNKAAAVVIGYFDCGGHCVVRLCKEHAQTLLAGLRSILDA